MPKYVIGIDPDSEAHGVATYLDGKLFRLKSMQLLELLGWLSFLIDQDGRDSIEIHIENVCANNSAFKKKGIKNAKAGTAINRSVGKCQQAQIEIERVFEHYEIKVIRHKISSSWKKDVSTFKFVTGWKGRSNEDTRSAAYFGYLGVR